LPDGESERPAPRYSTHGRDDAAVAEEFVLDCRGSTLAEGERGLFVEAFEAVRQLEARQ
jgi:hypothetical protein